MKKVFLLLSFLLLASCGIQRSIEKNTNQMSTAAASIEENTCEVRRSTANMKAMSVGLPIFFIVLGSMLFLFSYILFNLYRKVMLGKNPFPKKQKGIDGKMRMLKHLLRP